MTRTENASAHILGGGTGSTVARLRYTALRDATLPPILVEGFIPLFSSAASAHNVSAHNVVETREAQAPAA
jgi:hypothetical protein